MNDFGDVEARLRAALTDRADRVEPSGAGVALLERRVAAVRRAAARRRAVLSIAAAAVVLAVAVVGFGITRDDRETVTVTPSPTLLLPDGPAIWPLPSMDVRYGTPAEAATTFVEGYLGLPAAGCEIGGPADIRSARLEVCDTTVELRQDGAFGWVVVGADAATFRITAPGDGADVEGAFEVRTEPADAGAHVELRRLGELEPLDLGSAEPGAIVVVVATDERAGAVRVVDWSPATATSPTSVTATTQPSTTTSTTEAPTTTTTEPDDGALGWPGTADARFVGDPEEAALAFATDVLGFADPVLRATDADGDTAVVTLAPRPTAGAATTVFVHDTGRRGWVVTRTTSSEGSIETIVDTGDELVVEGVASAFEATVTVAVLGIDGTILAETFTQAGSQGEQAPFEASVGDGGEAAWFVLIGEGDASGEGRLTWAAVEPIGGA